jgi:hypothetical protein
MTAHAGNLGFGRALVLAGVVVLASGSLSQAQTPAPGFQAPLPADVKQVQDQLATYDQVAVAAARHYYQSPAVKKSLVTMVQGLTPSVVASVEKEKGRPLTEAEQGKVATSIDKAAEANLDLLTGLNIVAAVETLSKEQLLALDQFYTSPMGQSILASVPQLNQRLPGIFQMFMPKFSTSVETEIKAVGLGPN